MDILFFSRGRGRGHAARDVAIANELRRVRPHIEIGFASYDAGYRAFLAAGEMVFDMDLPEKNPFPSTVVKSERLIRKLKPQLVVAQEELAPLVAAAICYTKSVFTSHWFPLVRRDVHQAYEYASSVIFMEEEGLFVEPPEIVGRVKYCGPIIRTLDFNVDGAKKKRKDLGLSEQDLFILVLPGSPPEAREPIVELVIGAFKMLTDHAKCLMWIAGKDYEVLKKQVRYEQEIVIVESSFEVDQWILASNIVITKGTYNIGREVMALGRPSISLSHNYNWVDDFFSQRFITNRHLEAPLINKDLLAREIRAAVKSNLLLPDETMLNNSNAACAASHLLDALDGTAATRKNLMMP
jgi:UDP-N-acetylglucosamine:LPS N-acetylglucosamine transferase